MPRVIPINEIKVITEMKRSRRLALKYRKASIHSKRENGRVLVASAAALVSVTDKLT